MKVKYDMALKFTVSFSVIVVLVYASMIALAFYLDQRDKKTMNSQ